MRIQKKMIHNLMFNTKKHCFNVLIEIFLINIDYYFIEYNLLYNLIIKLFKN
jgi:hypothetical protein